jgi:hypothetical protein
MFEDSEGCRQGPHSLAELSYWHHNSYIQDFSMVWKSDMKILTFWISLILCVSKKSMYMCKL